MRGTLRDLAVARAHARILARLRCSHRMLPVRAERGLFNFRCHENCVEYVRTNPDRDLAVVETVYVDEGTPILHYVVHDRAEDAYLEVTLGWRAEGLEYYLTRTLTPADHRNIMKEFDRALRYWTDEHVPRWAQWLLGIERVT